MFEAEIERTKIRLAELLLPRSGGGVYLADVLDHAELDRAYKEFIRAEVEWQLYQDRIQRQLNLPLDTNDPLFRRVWGQVEDYVRRHAWFDRKHAVSLFDQAVKSVLNYRVRPRVTLKWFVYRGEPTKPVCEILLRLQYFADYSYLRTGFEQWMRDRGLERTSTHIMPIFEFERLVKHFDDEYILELSTREFIELLDPVFAFFNDAATPPALQTIPIEALIVFLDDKDIQVIAQKFERMLYHEGIRAVTRDAILRVVDQVLQELEQEQTSHYAPTVPAETEVEQAILESSAHPSGEQTAKPIDEETTPDEFGETDMQTQPALSVETAENLFTEDPTRGVETITRQKDIAQSIPPSPPDVSADVAPTESELNPATETASEAIADDIPHEKDIGNAQLAEQDLHTTAQVEIEPTSQFGERGAEQTTEDDGSVDDGDTVQTPIAENDSDSTGVAMSAVETGSTTDHAAQELPDDAIAELNALLSQPEQGEGENFDTDTIEQRRALEREFLIAAAEQEETASSEEASVDAADVNQHEQIPSTENATESARSTPPEPVVLDELLESGLQHVRVRMPAQTLPQQSLDELLDEDLKHAILKKLCAHDQFRFEGLLARLNAAPSVRAALNELDRYLADYALDPKMKAAQELRLALVKRYTLA